MLGRGRFADAGSIPAGSTFTPGVPDGKALAPHARQRGSIPRLGTMLRRRGGCPAGSHKPGLRVRLSAPLLFYPRRHLVRPSPCHGDEDGSIPFGGATFAAVAYVVKASG